jgi:hypothetical protein
MGLPNAYAVVGAAPASLPVHAPKASSQNLKKKLLAVEAEVAQLQAEQTALHSQLSQPTGPADLATAAKRLKVVDGQLELAEAQWLALAEGLEAHASA